MLTNLVVELKAPTSLKQEHFRRLRGHETVYKVKFSWLVCDFCYALYQVSFRNSRNDDRHSDHFHLRTKKALSYWN